jgi:hypothetical protein
LVVVIGFLPMLIVVLTVCVRGSVVVVIIVVTFLIISLAFVAVGIVVLTALWVARHIAKRLVGATDDATVSKLLNVIQKVSIEFRSVGYWPEHF